MTKPDFWENSYFLARLLHLIQYPLKSLSLDNDFKKLLRWDCDGKKIIKKGLLDVKDH